MWSRHVIWIFGGLFLLCGLPLLATEDVAWGHLWAGLSAFFLGCFALALSWNGVASGQIRFQFSVIERAKRPVLFWSTVTLVALAGLGTMASGIWLGLFKI